MSQQYWWKFFVAVALSAFCFAACSEATQEHADPPPDGQDETAFSAGKADDLFGACQLEHMLLLVNDPATDAEHLIDAGVHHRAARNIEAARAGSDGELGTDADTYFQSVEAIDEIYFVGPVAIQQLARAIADYCDDRPWLQAQTHFSPQSYYDSHIDRVVDELDAAQRSIDMAMYSLSDQRAFSALEDAANRGVQIRILFDSANGDHLDLPGSRSARLEELGADVRYINRTMHHKFAIIDGPQSELLQASQARFFSGSANLSFGAATRYDENTTFHRGDPALVLTMQREFNHLWQHSRNIEWNDDLQYFETLPIEENMIPARQDLEVLFTSNNFETTYSNRWGPGFRPIEFSEVVADRLVELIESARFSIDVAAGFLRSRPISQALMRRRAQDPELDIRIYLDQSEYISEWYHHRQESELDDCLADADGDESDIYDCQERGFIFSYTLLDDDIPVRFKNYSYRWHYSYALQMHHKYMIFDDTTVATGSYNFSNNAEQNTMENVVIYRRALYPEVVDAFAANFDEIWETGRDEGHFDDLMEHVESADEIELVFEPAALTFEQVTELRRAIRDRCPDVDSEPFRTQPQQHRRCTAQ